MLGLLKSFVKWMLDRRQDRVARNFALDVHELLDGEILHMVDVGASGGMLPRWRPCRVDVSFVGLEPDRRSYEALLQADEAREFHAYRLIPSGAWESDQTVTISFTRKPTCSSHFQPNVPFLRRFVDAERFDVITAGDVSCETLDHLLADPGMHADFIKLDLEGGELAVLTGARRTLAACIGLHVEVCFQQLRLGQPLFGPITEFLDELGLEFIDFVTIMRWERDHYRGLGQAVAADALYLRSPEGMIELVKAGVLDAAKLKRYLATLRIYGRCDLAEKTLDLSAAANLLGDEVYRQRARAVFARQQAELSGRAKFLARMSYVYSCWTNPNSSLHYIY